MVERKLDLMSRTARAIAQEYLDKTEKAYQSAKSEYFRSKYWLLWLGLFITISSALNGTDFILPWNGGSITIPKGSLQNLTTCLGALSALIQGYIQLKDPHTEWLKKFRSYMGVLFEINRYDVGAEPYGDPLHKDGQLVINTEKVIRSSLWSIDNREDGKAPQGTKPTPEAELSDNQPPASTEEIIVESSISQEPGEGSEN